MFMDDSDDNNNDDKPNKYRKIAKKKIKELDAGPNIISRKLASYWKEQVDINDEKWAGYIRRGNTIIKRYRDTRSNQDNNQARRMNVLWTNIQIMKPAVYSKCPQAIVERKFLDKDPVGRLSSQILERGVRNEISLGTTHSALSAAVDDYLLVGMGQVWARYEPDFGQGESLPAQATTSAEDELEEILNEQEGAGESEDENEIEDNREDDQETEDLESTGDQVIAEKVPLDYIDWHDFYMFPARARTWQEVQAVGKQVWMSRTECIEFFGKEIGSKIQPDPSYKNTSSTFEPYSDTAIFQEMNDRDRKVVEIWNKTDRRVYWVSTGYEYLCKVVNDPLKLSKFFPCPKPLFATTTNDSVEPVPDYLEYQDQAMMIDELTQRISMLAQACKVAGCYDGSNGALKRLLDEGYENKLVPVDSWAAFSDKGGVQGAMSFLPLKDIIQTIETLTNVRQTAKQDLDEVTGLSDILRGTTDSRETLGGLRLKNNNAGTRLSDRQQKVAEFARDAIAIQAEIMSKHFSDETLIDSSGIELEDELDPKTVFEDLMNDLDIQEHIQKQIQQKMQAAQQQMQQMMQMSMQQPQPPQIGGNVVPFGGNNQPPSQTPQQSPQASPQMQQMQQQLKQMPQMLQQQAEEALKKIVPEIIQSRIDKAIELLRKDVPFRYRIDIETDSTIFADAMQERDDANEFITSVTAFLTQGATFAQTLPEVTPLLGKMLQFAVRKFRTGRDLENAIDNFCVQMDKKAKQTAQNPPPNPEMQKQQLELQKTQMDIQAQRENDQRDAQRQEADDQRKSQQDQMDQQRDEKKFAMDMQLEQMRFALEKEKLGMQQQADMQDHQLKSKEQHNSMVMDALTSQRELEMADKQHEQTIQQTDQKHQQSMQVSKEQHKQKLSQAKKPEPKKKESKK